jgi:hypothetical protein
MNARGWDFLVVVIVASSVFPDNYPLKYAASVRQKGYPKDRKLPGRRKLSQEQPNCETTSALAQTPF